MKKLHRRRPSTRLGVSATWTKVAVAAILLLASSTAFAVIRKGGDISTFFNPAVSSGMMSFFDSPESNWTIAGGVVLAGHAQFYNEVNGRPTAIPATAVSLAIDKAGKIYLVENGRSYNVEIFPHFACPLGHFIERGAIIAYTELDDPTPAMVKRLEKAGLVDSNISSAFDNSVSIDFENTVFERLFAKADYAEVVSMPAEIKIPALARINQAIGGANSPTNDQAFLVHADFQITYKIYLVDESHRVETAGVPLRYRINYKAGGLPYFRDIAILSENWADDERVTDLTDVTKPVTSYDVVSAFQMGAIFRELREADGAAFNAFLEKACNS